MLDYYVVVFILGVLGIYSVFVFIYMFEFNYRFVESDIDVWMGVVYGENMFYVFGVLFLNSIVLNFINEDWNISCLIMIFYVNFVKYGNLIFYWVYGVIWDRFNIVSKLYLCINNRFYMGVYYDCW